MGKKNIVWNDYISQEERFADFFNGVVFQGEQVVFPEDLAPLDSKLWRRQPDKNSYNEFIRDTVKLWQHEDEKYILSLEPEDSPHHALPVKYMNYESVQYDRQYKENMKAHRKNRDLCSDEYLAGFSVSDRLFPVVTIGIYLGEKKWSGSSRLSDITGISEKTGKISRYFAPLCNEFRVNLVNIYDLETCDVFQSDLREVFGFLRLRGDKAQLRNYVEENEGFRHLQEDAFDVLSVYGTMDLKIDREEYRTKEGIDMCLALQQWEEEARAEGRAKGKAEGTAQGIAAMNELIYVMVKEGRAEELLRSSRDYDFQRKLMEECGIQMLM